jgi:hypothetical protein
MWKVAFPELIVNMIPIRQGLDTRITSKLILLDRQGIAL